jgi:hypothetical protein
MGKYNDLIDKFQLLITNYNNNSIFLVNKKNLRLYQIGFKSDMDQHIIDECNLKYDFIELIKPIEYIESEHKSHSQLLHLFDRKIKLEIFEIGSDYDKARINALSANGSMSWLNLPYNYKWSIQFPNRIFFILKSLILGNKLCNNDNNECKRCKK